MSFATTLKGSTWMWYNHLPPNSIHDFQEFGTKFVVHFMGGRIYSKPSAHLFTIQQKGGESLKSYYHRFHQEILMINDLNDGVAVATFLKGVGSSDCLMTLARETPRTIIDLNEELDKHIRVEELLGGESCLPSQDLSLYTLHQNRELVTSPFFLSVMDYICY